MTDCSTINNTFKLIECYLINNLYLIAFVETIIFSLIVYGLHHYDPFKIVSKHYNYFILLVLFLFFLFLMYFYFLKERKVNFGNNKSIRPDKENYNNPLILFIKKIAAVMTLSLLAILLIAGVFWLFNNISFLGTVSLYGLLLFSAIILLAVVYTFHKGSIDAHMKSDKSKEETKSKLAFFIKLVFYLPCLMNNFVEYMIKQFKITAKPVWILLFVELFIITFYFLIPFIVKIISFHEGKELLKDPIYTNNQTTLGTFENLSNVNLKDNFKYRYGLSFWLYINPQSPNTNPSYSKYTSLFNYANKPNIMYNGKKNSLKIVSQNKEKDLETIYETSDIKYQKWMHFIVNYDSGIMDVFIDNELVASKSGIAPYMTLDKVTAGENNGIHGGIKDVVYFNRIIPTNQIMMLFGSAEDSVSKKLKKAPKYIKEAKKYITKSIYDAEKDLSDIDKSIDKGLAKLSSG